MALIRPVLAVALVAILFALMPSNEAVVSHALMLSMRPILLYCAYENNINHTLLNAIIANDLSTNTHDTQCLTLCFLNKLGMFDNDGNIHVQSSIDKFSLGEDRTFVTEVVNQCKDFQGANACETASLVYACYVEKHLL